MDLIKSLTDLIFPSAPSASSAAELRQLTSRSISLSVTEDGVNNMGRTKGVARCLDKQTRCNSLKRSPSQASLNTEQKHQSQRAKMMQDRDDLESENSSLEVENARLRRIIRDLQQRNASLQKIKECMPRVEEMRNMVTSCEQHQKELRAAHETITSQQISIESYKNDRQAKSQQARKLKESYDTAVGRSEHNRIKIQELEEKCCALQNTNNRLQAQVSGQNELIRKAQAETFRAQNKGTWLIDPDAMLEGELGSLQRMIEKFCKTHAAKRPSGMHLLELIPPGLCGMADFTTGDAIPALTANRWARTAMHLLFFGWLTQQVYSAIFGNAFMSVQELLAKTSSENTELAENTISKFFKFLEQCQSRACGTRKRQ